VFPTAIHIFRRDLRLNDNTSLNSLEGELVLPVFIFDPNQSDKNPYFSTPGFELLCGALQEIKPLILSGDPAEEIRKLIELYPSIKKVSFNRDYTPFSKLRDSKIHSVVTELGRECLIHDDTLLISPESGLKTDGTPYTVFSPFFKKNKIKQILQPNTAKISFAPYEHLFEPKKTRAGRSAATEILKNISRFQNYKEERNIPSISATSHLSAHHKFGTVSIRETYHSIKEAFGLEHHMIQELYWRDFFHHIAFYFPHVFKGAFNKRYNNINWSENEDDFERWCKGETGFPIVDAGMRELNETGFMHNRVRMIVASFLCKDLHISWRWGERYFANKLVDYDPCVNNGNWQWAASTGCDAQPYFRIFNPWLQQEKFDLQCVYIKKWVPELRNRSNKEIHSEPKSSSYPSPMVDHSTASAKAKELFSS